VNLLLTHQRSQQLSLFAKPSPPQTPVAEQLAGPMGMSFGVAIKYGADGVDPFGEQPSAGTVEALNKLVATAVRNDG